MQTNRLTDAEIRKIQHELEKWHLENGPQILGSQLGTLVHPITNRPLRELGGARSLVGQELSQLVELAAVQSNPPDVSFTIRIDSVSRPLTSNVLAGATDEVPAVDLWRQFANPRLAGKIAANAVGRVIVVSACSELPIEFTSIAKPTADDYRDLARQFLEQQSDVLKAQLMDAFNNPDFYNEWIQRLRSLSSLSLNLLQNWEILRAGFVEKQLVAELVKCGMDPIAAAELTAQAQTRRIRFPPSTPQISTRTAPFRAINDSGSDLRRIIHTVVDLMSIDELRQLPISAGLLYDANRRLTR